MAGQRTTFAKLQRDRAKKAKADAKRERRHDRSTEPDTETGSSEAPAAGGQVLSASELLRRVEDIHRRFDAGKLSYEEFEEQKADLLARLPVD